MQGLCRATSWCSIEISSKYRVLDLFSNQMNELNWHLSQYKYQNDKRHVQKEKIR
ncbi:hypothetical protein A1Q_2186 [Vibrio campbellii HY01]|nr:hypothetical protein A1Q_2186 [Vibrio campbellii HY01]